MNNGKIEMIMKLPAQTNSTHIDEEMTEAMTTAIEPLTN